MDLLFGRGKDTVIDRKSSWDGEKLGLYLGLHIGLGFMSGMVTARTGIRVTANCFVAGDGVNQVELGLHALIPTSTQPPITSI